MGVVRPDAFPERQHKRVTTGNIAAAGSANVTVTWNAAFPDTNYTVAADVQCTTAAINLRVLKCMSQSASQIVVKVINDDPLNARTGTVFATAFRDVNL